MPKSSIGAGPCPSLASLPWQPQVCQARKGVSNGKLHLHSSDQAVTLTLEARPQNLTTQLYPYRSLMASHRSARSVSRKNTPVSPPKSTSADEVPRQNTRNTRSKSREVAEQSQTQPAVNQHLATVTEECEGQEREYAQPNGPSEPEDAASPGRSGSAPPSVSSSTYTSDSQDELETLDSDALIDNLEDLYHDATSLLSFFRTPDTASLISLHNHLRSPSSSMWKRLQTRIKRFAISREAYGGRVYVKPSLIARKIAAIRGREQLEDGPWRPDAVLQLANLALHLVTMFTGAEEQISNSLQFMFNSFPTPFIDGSPSGFSPTKKRRETTSMGIHLRTQVFIRAVQANISEPSFDPDSILSQVFWSEDGQLRMPEGEGDLSPEDIARIHQHIAEVREHLSTDSNDPIDVDALQDRYPWQDFVVRLARWSRLRQDELDAKISSQGGVAKIVERLRSDDLGSSLDQATGEIPSPERTHGPRPKANVARASKQAGADRIASPLPEKRPLSKPLSRRVMQKNVERLKELKAEKAVRQSGASERVDITPSAAERVRQTPSSPVQSEALPGPDKESHPLRHPNPSPSQHIIPTQQTAFVLETLRRQAAESNKENIDVARKQRSFHDRQPTAQREEWSETGESEQPRRPRKRPRPDEADDSGAESDFEIDLRSSKRARTEKGKQRAVVTQTPPREDLHGEYVSESEQQDVEQVVQNEAQQPTSAQPTRLPLQPRRITTHPSSGPPTPVVASSSQQPISPPPPPPPPPPPRSQLPLSSQYIEANAQAKAAVRLYKEHALDMGRAVQVRKPYTEAEVSRLMELIEINGTKWVEILKQDRAHPDGPRLQNRSQVHLKDKARNIKIDFLKYVLLHPPSSLSRFLNVSICVYRVE